MKMKAILPIGVLVLGAAAAFMLASSRATPERRPNERVAPLVDTVVATRANAAIPIAGHGTVRPRIEVELAAQVSGRIVATDPSFASGSVFPARAVLVRIDPSDFELLVQRAAAEVAKAEVRVQTEEAEAALATREWGELYPGQDPPSPLVVRGPQVAQARAELDAASANLAKAKLDLARTAISVPFTGRVISESVDVGQLVMAGQPIGRVYGTDVLEVPIPLDDRDLQWLAMPTGDSTTGVECDVTVDFAGTRHRWAGRIVRTEGVDAQSRLVTLVAAVEDALEPGRPPLLPGMFVDVEIRTAVLEDAIALPRQAVRSGDAVWLVRDGRLFIQPVTVARTTRDLAYVVGGLEAGAEVVLSTLEGVTDGMAVRTSAPAAVGDEPVHSA